MSAKTIYGQIVGLRKLHNSKMGNPKYLVRIYKMDETIELRTKTDAGFVYAITDRWLKQWATFVVQGNQRQVISDMRLDKTS